MSTVVQLGWSGVLNGELMRRAREHCDAFVTLDRNIEFQQNIPLLPFGVIVVRAASNRMVHLRPLATAIHLPFQRLTGITVIFSFTKWDIYLEKWGCLGKAQAQIRLICSQG